MRGKKSKWIRSCVVLLIAVMVAGGAVTAVRAAIEAVVTRTSEENVLVEVNGTYSSATKDEVLNRINEIRKEACDEGITINGVALTAEDYNPIKWSSDLECIAQTRAVEAAVNESHTRPNGTSYSDVTYNSLTSEAENLAWGEGMLDSIEQWYAQKEALVNGTGEATGYYLEMINPDYTYIGLASFKADNSNWIATAGEFSANSEALDETKLTISSDTTQIVEVMSSSLSGMYVDGNTSISINETSKFMLGANTVNKNINGEELILPVTIIEGAEWLSADTSIATVDQQGNVTGVSIGVVEVSAEAGNTKLIMEITVSDVSEAITSPEAAEEETTEETEAVNEEVAEEETTGTVEELDKLVLGGDESGEGSMIGTYSSPIVEDAASDEYKYLGYVSFLDMVSGDFVDEGNYRYLVMNYTGDISRLRIDFEHYEDGARELQGAFWFNPEGQSSYFVSADGNDIPLVGDNTTIVIDLLNSVHPDNGVDLEGVDLSWYNTGMHMHCDMMATYGNGQGITISYAYLAKTVPIEEKFIHIEAENYDSMSGVELRGTYDQGTDVLKSVDAGDYMIYTVNVEEAGMYRFDARAARSDAGSSVLSFMENDIVIGTISVAQTGGWESFAEFEGSEVYLTEGTHTLKVYATGGRYNLNWYQLVKVSDINDDASTNDIHIEAENYDSMSGVELRGTYDQGTDVLKSVDAGDYMIYTVDVKETGVYRFDVRAARKYAGSSVLSLMENDSVVATVSVASTDSWTTFAEFEGTKMYLTEGTHTLKVYATQGSYNLNWYELVFVTGDSVHIEAEDYDSMSGVALRGIYDQGTDVLKSVDAGDYMIYTVNIPISATYRFDVRAARSDAGSSVLSLMENDSVVATVNISQTGGWGTFAEFEGTEVYLTEGVHALKVYADNGRYNLNWYEFTIVSVDGQ